MSASLHDVTPLVLTCNESANVRRCLERLRWARRVVLLDSFSTDDTLTIAREFPNVEIVQRAFDSFASQCNFGLEQVRTTWVLSMDCDYVLGEGFEEEVTGCIASSETDGWRAAFRFCIHGQPLHASLYPARCVLYKRAAARYEDEGHGHRVRIGGTIKDMRTLIDHDDRKPLVRWLSAQVRYAEDEAQYLLADAGALGRIDRVRARGWLMPLLAPAYCLVWKGLWRDGLAGWHYTLQRWLAEIIIALAVVDLKIRRRASGE